jgi:hypothetical protein
VADSYPLQWPAGWPRCDLPQRAQFKDHSIYVVSSQVENELRRLGASSIVVSANLIRNMDGGIRSKQAQPVDRGVAVYFQYMGREQCIPCDRWSRVEDNLRAIALTIEALRGLERWGAKEMVSAAFRGFLALPEKTGGIDYFRDCSSEEEVKARYRELAKSFHPDRGGSADEFAELSNQYKERLGDSL